MRKLPPLSVIACRRNGNRTPRRGFHGRGAKGSVFPDSFDRVMPALARNGRSADRIEQVCINVCNGAHEAEAREVLARIAAWNESRFYRIPTNEPWCRDHGPIFLTRDD